MLGHERMEKKKKKMENGKFTPLSLSIRGPLSLSLIQKQRALPCALCPCSSVHLWIFEDRLGKSTIWWYFEFQSSLILMLLSIFYSPQITASCILSRFYIFHQWEILPCSELEWGLLVFSTFIATFQMQMTQKYEIGLSIII